MKASASVIAASGPDGLVATSLVGALGIALEALGLLGEKRTKELFDNDDLVKSVVAKIQASDDFASFVFSVWQKYNLESSKDRRAYLKKFLQVESSKSENDFVNFSKVEYIIQNASLKSLELLIQFHSKPIYGRPVDPKDGRSYLLNADDIARELDKTEFKVPAQDLEYLLNELCNYNLIAVSHGRFDGPFYNHTKLAFVLLEYINT
ncbi:MAG: hypothetical protein JWL85_17 [Candidatus Saccharibacteria bacterium]|nr:hypothetical protein [Candidatus Saccharibacteria bacterium]